MKITPIANCFLISPLLLVFFSISGCEAITSASQNSDCATHLGGFQTSVEDEGKLSEGVAEEAPYPMAIIISQDALNQIFSAIADADLPDVPLVDDLLGVSVTLHPQLPLIQVGGELDCLECLLTELAFGLTVEVADDVVTGTGLGRYQFPLGLQPNGLDSTKVTAQLGQSTLLQVDLSISGLDDDIMDAIEPLIAGAATLIIQETVGDTELFELGAWSFGDGDVTMLARGPIIEPDFGTVVLGIHTNMVQPLSSAVTIDPLLPEGADIGIQFHPELLQVMAQRMMFEGHIDRSYDTAGQPDDSGDHQMSLNEMKASPSDLLTTSFRLWRTGGGLCGFADIQADLGLSISDEAFDLSVQNVDITDGEGIGELLVAADNWYQSEFTQSLIEYTELTINYQEFDLPGDKVAEMSAESFRLTVDGRGLSVFLNIDEIIGSVD